MTAGEALLVIGEAAKYFGTDRKVIGTVVASRGIQTMPMPYSGKAKGLNLRGLCEIADALGKPHPTSKSVRDWKASKLQAA